MIQEYLKYKEIPNLTLAFRYIRDKVWDEYSNHPIEIWYVRNYPTEFESLSKLPAAIKQSLR